MLENNSDEFATQHVKFEDANDEENNEEEEEEFAAAPKIDTGSNKNLVLSQQQMDMSPTDAMLLITKPSDLNFPYDMNDDYDKYWDEHLNEDVRWKYKVITFTMKFVSFVLLFIALLSITSMVWNAIVLGAQWNKNQVFEKNGATALLVFYCFILVSLAAHTSVWLSLAALCFLTTMRIPYKMHLSIAFTACLILEVAVQFVQTIPNAFITFYLLRAHPDLRDKVQPVGFFISSALGMAILVFFAIIGVGLSIHHTKMIIARHDQVQILRTKLLYSQQDDKEPRLVLIAPPDEDNTEHKHDEQQQSQQQGATTTTEQQV